MPEQERISSRFMNAAIHAVKIAAKVSLSGYGNPGARFYKGPEKELFTIFDVEAEKAIVDELTKSFTSHSIIGEEGYRNINLRSPYKWIIDALDGTNNFNRGIGPYGVSLALAHKENVILGVVYNPLSDELFTAAKGAGAFRNGKKLSVSGISNLSEALIFSSALYKTPQALSLIQAVKDLRVTGSTAYEMCLVAAGRAEGFLKIDDAPWDFAAAGLIAEEAGALVTNFDGSPWNIHSTRLLIANPVLHSQISTLLGS